MYIQKFLYSALIGLTVDQRVKKLSRTLCLGIKHFRYTFLLAYEGHFVPTKKDSQ